MRSYAEILREISRVESELRALQDQTILAAHAAGRFKKGTVEAVLFTRYVSTRSLRVLTSAQADVAEFLFQAATE